MKFPKSPLTRSQDERGWGKLWSTRQRRRHTFAMDRKLPLPRSEIPLQWLVLCRRVQVILLSLKPPHGVRCTVVTARLQPPLWSVTVAGTRLAVNFNTNKRTVYSSVCVGEITSETGVSICILACLGYFSWTVLYKHVPRPLLLLDVESVDTV